MKPEKLFDRVYDDYDKYMIVPVALMVLAIGILGFNAATNGEFLQKGIDFTGGTEITYSVQGEFTAVQAERAFQDSGRNDVQAVKQISGNNTLLLVSLPPPELSEEQAETILNDAGIQATAEGFRSISPSVSGAFFQQAQVAFALAFTIMSLVIFVAFKDVVPSLAVIFAALGDVLIAAAGMSILGIPLTLGSLAALLMLIGYSVDTDIVLSTRVLKRNRGSVKSRVWSSIKTGVTMSSGGIAGFILLYFVSSSIVGPSELSNIAAVMVMGLLADMPLTWLGNAIVLKKYVNGEVKTPWN
ncbi:protein translocase subunit SecF [Candidatus Nanohalococcus occultus]|uniref:Protein-export membrane protein SecF n=1 Tax=Candidatus Nanohalococcus occultus TaxID=2978047 RepID=A0ABY8CFS3_9ARCH|nr:Preprotein translocase subunit SecF [Candidatus Nanohaloarchaeota archaeon SVXNc]